MALSAQIRFDSTFVAFIWIGREVPYMLIQMHYYSLGKLARPPVLIKCWSCCFFSCFFLFLDRDLFDIAFVARTHNTESPHYDLKKNKLNLFVFKVS